MSGTSYAGRNADVNATQVDGISATAEPGRPRPCKRYREAVRFPSALPVDAADHATVRFVGSSPRTTIHPAAIIAAPSDTNSAISARPLTVISNLSA